MYRHYARHIIHTHTHTHTHIFSMKQLYEENIITILWFREVYVACPRLHG